jgi:hypothetical protein
MSRLDQQYALGIAIARNQFILRETRDPKLRAAVCRDTQDLRRQIAEVA